MSIFIKNFQGLWAASLDKHQTSIIDAAKIIGIDRGNLSRQLNSDVEYNLKALLRWAVYSGTPLTELGLDVDDSLFPVHKLDGDLRRTLQSDWDLLLPKKLYHAGFALLISELSEEMSQRSIAEKMGYKSAGIIPRYRDPKWTQSPSVVAALRICNTFGIESWRVGFNFYLPGDVEKVAAYQDTLKQEFDKRWPGYA